MSDTDSESAFESADEGDEEFHHEAVALDPQPSSDLNNGFAGKTDPPQDDSLKNSKSEVAKTSGALRHSERSESEPIGAEGSMQVSSTDPKDEGLGDWDTGWEIDDNMTVDSDLPCTGVSSIRLSSDPHETNPNLKVDSTNCSEELNTSSRTVEPAEVDTKLKESQDITKKTNESVENQQTQKQSWGWGGWGASLLSTATSSVSSFTSQVGQGLNTVLESVESTLGVPPPEELASQIAAEQSSDSALPEEPQTTNPNEQKSQPLSFIGSAISVGSLVSGVSSLTSVIEQTGSKVMSGGLDTLERIGKKTMDLLQEGDPGLKKKRSLLKQDKPNLSEVLREAKERHKEALQSTNSDGDYQVNFSSVFDEQQGLVHLEALEMLSRQSEQKIQIALLSLSGNELEELQSHLEKIKESYEVQSSDEVDDSYDHDFPALIVKLIEQLKVVVNIDKLLKVQSEGRNWLNDFSNDEDKMKPTFLKETHSKAIYFMADYTAKVVEVIHKIAELMLITHGVDAMDAVGHLSSLTNTICAELTIMSNKYSSSLNSASKANEDPDFVNSMITNIYLEAANSNTYIQDACQLVLPILQLNYVQT